MKNRPITIALIIAAVLIWAWIMYSVFDYMESPDIAIVNDKKMHVSIVKEDTITTDYVLALNYKDPFLKKDYNSKSNNNSQASFSGYSSSAQSLTDKVKTKKVALPAIDKTEIPLPVINYVGRIQNAKLNKPVAILVIDNHEYMMQEGEVNAGVTLSQIKNDSVKVMYLKKIFYVRKQ
jgi:hypothetical protein